VEEGWLQEAKSLEANPSSSRRVLPGNAFGTAPERFAGFHKLASIEW
jgi:hypothetical protein